MKLLLTDAGVRNPSIHDALLDLLDKPINECKALCIPTAAYGHPMTGPYKAWDFISGAEPYCPMAELGWQAVGNLELTALPSLDPDLWHPWLREADALLVAGGDTSYLAYWLRKSGVAELLPSLDIVWVGLSAGSVVMTPVIAPRFVNWSSPTGGDEPLGLVDFTLFPHLDSEGLPTHSMAHAERWAASMPGPAYATDNETAIIVVDGVVEVVSEGTWRLFNT